MSASLFPIAHGHRAALAIVASLTILFLGASGFVQGSPLESRDPGLGERSETAQQKPEVLPLGHSAGRGFFPLDIGNHWTYSGELSLTGDDLPPHVIRTREERTIIGTEHLFGREYALEQQETTEDMSADVCTFWVRYRQDRAGLYEADVAVSQPPAGMYSSITDEPVSEDVLGAYMTRFRQHIAEATEPQYRDLYLGVCDHLLKKVEAVNGLFRRGMPGASAPAGPPGGVLQEEITRLQYPLHPGQEWAIRADPWFAASVERREVLDLIPGRMSGYRVSVVNEAMSPGDVVIVWYGQEGFLGMFVHLASEVRDPDGNPVGNLVFEQRLSLDSLQLARGR